MERTHTHRSGRLSASTLLETVLAMALMACALAFALWMHVRILATDQAMVRLSAWSLTEEFLLHPQGTTIKSDDGAIQLDVKRWSVVPGIDRIVLTCSQADRVVLVRNSIVPSP